MPDLSGVANIVVFGVGGGGGNSVNRMKIEGLTTPKFVAANTDLHVLNMSQADVRIQLGPILTKGRGCGADADKGRKAAEESREEIRRVLEGCDLLFIAAGMGGGTGTGAAPVIAQIAREMDILTIAVVTKPLLFEGAKREQNAIQGIERLREHVDTMLIVSNERISAFVPKDTSMMAAFQIADDVLKQGIQGITDIITTPSIINLDFADVETILKLKGNAHIGIGIGKGDNRALDAVRQAVQSPLLETNISGAKGMIIYVTGDKNSLTISEVHHAAGLVKDVVDPNCNVIFGMGLDERMNNEVKVTIIATGFDAVPKRQIKPQGYTANLNNEARIREMMNAQKQNTPPPSSYSMNAPRPANNDGITPTLTESAGNIPPYLQRMQEKNK